MKNPGLRLTLAILVFFSSCLLAIPNASAELKVGSKAPNFVLFDSSGQKRSLEEFKGKTVVLEWLNFGCPYVKKHYDSGNMQKLQNTYTEKGVVWLSIASSAEGKEGYMNQEQAKEQGKSKGSKASEILLDPEGTVGRTYFAKTTPHMFIINANGELVYQGAIDDQRSTRASSIEGAKNYISQALDQILANQPISEAETEPYGCSIKYK